LEYDLAYVVGIDLGTSYSAAAIGHPDGRVEMFQLGLRAAAVPSLIVARDGGEMLVGEAAERRALTEPTRTAREFKRRLGDPVPLILGGTPYGAEALLAILLRTFIDQVAQEMAGRPSHVVITHPASYGPYKLDLLRQAARQADIPSVSFASEPVAAAVHYASLEQVPTGAQIAVYDFGGGTFDATILRTTEAGFEAAGTPEGLERLGGIDFDEALFRHVLDSLGDRVRGLDSADVAVQAGFARLREECRRAKEALSADSDATIAVSLPGIQTEVRITRPEFEAMIEPRISETTAALERACRSAGARIEDIDRILLVGGTSRIPRIAERLRAATGRRIAIDAHPKHSVALGAARLGLAALPAETEFANIGAPATAAEPPEPARPTPVSATGPALPQPARLAPAGSGSSRGFRPVPVVLAGVGAFALTAVLLVASGMLGSGPAASPASTVRAGVPTLPPAPTPLPTFAAGLHASITDIRLAGDRYETAFTTTGFTPGGGGAHVHFYWDTVPADQAGSPEAGPYVVYMGESPFRDLGPATRPPTAKALCVIVANPDHTVVPGSGGCAALP
jgi:actin-like ATPase involved in cell morphogenesis